MEQNEGKIDRWIRAILGIALLYFSYTMFSGIGQIIGFILGLILFFTSISGFCLLYLPLGINTRKKIEG
jgi:hypothetical protein